MRYNYYCFQYAFRLTHNLTIFFIPIYNAYMISYKDCDGQLFKWTIILKSTFHLFSFLMAIQYHYKDCNSMEKLFTKCLLSARDSYRSYQGYY